MIESFDQNRATANECVYYWHALRIMGFSDKEVRYNVEGTRVVIDVKRGNHDFRFLVAEFVGPPVLFFNDLRLMLETYGKDVRPYIENWPQSKPFTLFTALLDKLLDVGFVINPPPLFTPR